jgi:sugar-specific transcriptional regulator TrmB
MEAKSLWERLFENIGLSKNEAKIYSCLALGGPSEARKLSLASGVPRTKIYGVLKKLAERGLVVETPGDPSRFAVTSPAESYKAFLQSLKDELSEQVTTVVETENAISVLEEIHRKRRMIKPIESQMGDVWLIQGREAMLQKAREMLLKTKKSVEMLTTEKGLIMFYKAFNKLLDRLVEKHVKVRIRVPSGSSSKSLTHELRYEAKMESADVNLPILFLTVDKSELLLVKLNPDDFSLESEKDSGFFSQNLTLCTFFSSLFCPIKNR